MLYRKWFLLTASLLMSIHGASCEAVISSGSSQAQQFSDIPLIDEVQPIAEISIGEEGYLEYLDFSGTSTRRFRGEMSVTLHPGYVIVSKKNRLFIIPQERVVFIGEKQPDFYGE